MKGQGLIHVFSNGLGPAVMTAVGGRLIDRGGINAMLGFTSAAAALGFVVVLAATAHFWEKRSNRT